MARRSDSRLRPVHARTRLRTKLLSALRLCPLLRTAGLHVYAAGPLWLSKLHAARHVHAVPDLSLFLHARFLPHASFHCQASQTGASAIAAKAVFGGPAMIRHTATVLRVAAAMGLGF